MRTIKFRARTAHTKKWLYWTIWEPLSDEEMTGLDSSTLGEFTGLKDKNGVEIYEGDILQSTWRPTDKWLVEWSDKEGGWKFFPDIDETGGRYKGTIIIGNQFENPELLS